MHDVRIASRTRWIALGFAALMGQTVLHAADPKPDAAPVDFNREIRPILSNQCFTCHGPDVRKRKGVAKPLRLDTEDGVFGDLGGYSAVVKGKPEESELLERIKADDATAMPPKGHGKRLSPAEVAKFEAWIKQGAPYAKHWSYVIPTRPELPRETKNPIDAFILARLDSEGLKPSPIADRATLIRRVSLDLTGLPPTPAEVEAFAKDARPDAYERLVDSLLARPSFGEHWARYWLDLARYADSSGYADDPPRTIWAYRDYVIRSFNANTPFDRFTVEQLAGDLLPNPTDDQLVATAFHRNTLTNNEGGTNDEEFRTVAVVDRVNTTLAVWMGTTIACAQCHDHKYDPISQEEYFKVYAILNNTADADRGDESPTLPLFSQAQVTQKAEWQKRVGELEKSLKSPRREALSGLPAWAETLKVEPEWRSVEPVSVEARGGSKATVLKDQSIRIAANPDVKTDAYTVQIALGDRPVEAIRLETLPDDSLPGKGPGLSPGNGNFVLSRVVAQVQEPGKSAPVARYVRVDLPGKERILSLAEVQVFEDGANVAPRGDAKQSGIAYGGEPRRAIDSNTNGDYYGANSTTHTEPQANPFWELDLKADRRVEKVVVWNRTDGNVGSRLAGYTLNLLDADRKPIRTLKDQGAPAPSTTLAMDGPRTVTLASAFADYEQTDFGAASVIGNTDLRNKGWAVGGKLGEPHTLTLVPATPIAAKPGSVLILKLEQVSKFENHTIGRFRLATTSDPKAIAIARVPAPIAAIARMPKSKRSDAQVAELERHYAAEVSPELKKDREELAKVRKQLADLKPETTVPIYRELAGKDRRVTKLQYRGNYLDLGPDVKEGVPAAFGGLPKDAKPDRLALAKWLVSDRNPLTARVMANRFWEQIFGQGLVATSEEFGAQGEQPSHPELLDWLATELVRTKWDVKKFLKLLVTSDAYKQASKVSPDLVQRDPENRLLARGPRFRLPAETIRDQALAVSGLLSSKMHGAPVKPLQPSSGLNAAFGSMIDWQTSMGEDRYRRGIYTTWRRSNPYPSMTTFDAPNREVCTLKRSRTNTPLQALVTLNDPVYVEAAQALARRMVKEGGPRVAGRIDRGVFLCLARIPGDEERSRLERLFTDARAVFAKDPERARKLATDPLGPLPKEADPAEFAAWTVLGNVLLNLDETLMKR